MSGIAGFIRLDGTPAAQAQLEPMLASLAHRGPDGFASWCGGAASFGHGMLWTTPQSLAEKLPLVDADRGLVITADARIDNRDDLCRELAVPAVERRSLADSALILLAYARWSFDCPAHLLGDFAFAVWDMRRREFFCARDPTGARPFYFHHGPRLFAFASEVKAILALDDVPRRLDEGRLADYLTQVTGDLEATFYRGISRLPPASAMQVSARGLQRRRYWRLEPSDARRPPCR